MSSLSKLREERFLAALTTSFPGSEWVEESRASQVLEMVTIGTGPGPKNVLANDGVVYPYRKFKALKGGPWPASTLSTAAQASGDTLPPGGVRGYVVVCGKPYDAEKIRKWAESLPAGTPIVTETPDVSVKGIPKNGAAVIHSALPTAMIYPFGEEYFGGTWRDHQARVMAIYAFNEGYDLITFAKTKSKRCTMAMEVFDGLTNARI